MSEPAEVAVVVSGYDTMHIRPICLEIGLSILAGALENYSASNGRLSEPECVRCRLTWDLN